jgi:hypothetical protein
MWVLDFYPFRLDIQFCTEKCKAPKMGKMAEIELGKEADVDRPY